MKSYHQVLVPALDALIGNPELLSPSADTKKKADILAIPAHFIMRATELRGEQSSRGDACGELLKQFNNILGDIHRDGKHICANGMKIVFIEDESITKVPHRFNNYEPNSSKLETIKAAKLYREKHLENGQTLAILTGDNAMSSLAYQEDFDVAHINPDVYTGRRKVVMPDEVYMEWMSRSEMTEEEFKAFFPNEKPLHINEFVEFMAAPGVPFGNNNYFGHIARFEPGKTPILRQLHHLKEYKGRIYPRNAGQAMLLEALMISADEVPIVICPGLFGTGKTYCATASAYFQTLEMGDNAPYERIFVVPSEGSPGGRDLGALPGTKDEKIAPMIAPIKDNLYNYLRAKGDKVKGGKPKTRQDVLRDVNNAIFKVFELENLQYIGGRSIARSIILYDEAQALERFQMRQLLTRIGEGSKMVCLGDPSQVYNRHMNANSNGLSWAASKLAGNPYASVVTLTRDEVERSEAARAIAACIG